MKIMELRQKSREELQKMLLEKRNQKLSLRFNIASGRVKNLEELRELKKDVARILTLLASTSLSK